MSPIANALYSIGLFSSLAVLSTWFDRRQRNRTRRLATIQRVLNPER